jgi:hypothetical protein
VISDKSKILFRKIKVWSVSYLKWPYLLHYNLKRVIRGKRPWGRDPFWWAFHTPKIGARKGAGPFPGRRCPPGPPTRSWRTSAPGTATTTFGSPLRYRCCCWCSAVAGCSVGRREASRAIGRRFDVDHRQAVPGLDRLRKKFWKCVHKINYDVYFNYTLYVLAPVIKLYLLKWKSVLKMKIDRIRYKGKNN